MGTLMYPPAVPLGYDDTVFYFAEAEELQLGGMTTGNLSGHAVSNEDQMMFDIGHYDTDIESSNLRAQSPSFTGSTTVASDWYPSHAEVAVASHRLSSQSTMMPAVESVSGGSSRSPAANSQVLTPTSTLEEYNPSIGDSAFLDEEDTDENLSPTSDRSYVHVQPRGLHPSASLSGPQLSQMSGHHQHPPSSQGSGASDSQQLSRASSLAPSTSSFQGGQWGAMQAGGSSFTDNQQIYHVPRDTAAYYSSNFYPQSTQAFSSSENYGGDVVLADLSMDTPMFDTPIPLRPGHPQHMMGQQNIYGGSSAFNPGYNTPPFRAYNQTHSPAHQHPHHDPRYRQQHVVRQVPAGSFPTELSIPSTDALLVHPQTIPMIAPPKMEEIKPSPSPIPAAANVARRSIATIPSHRTSPYPQPQPRPAHAHTTTIQSSQYSVAGLVRPPPMGPGASKRPLQAAKARPTLPSNAPRASAAEQNRKGGRQRGKHLSETAKAKSHQMRKDGACWRCALQRDPCDLGMPCGRCLMRAQKGQTYYFECDRSKLPDFVHDFLPAQATMTLMHQKQTIEDTVVDQVQHWDKEHPITVYLTSGYGPPLRWILHEFKPRTDDLLGQFQYLQDPATGKQRRFHKYSPPFGLLKLDNSDDDYLSKYLKSLLTEDYIWDLGWTCFEEESQVDDEHFQAGLVDLMSKLFLRTEDQKLKDLLENLLRMLIITYIMGHTLTIVEDTLPSVLDAIRYSVKGPNQQFTSPRLANRQLKFYFAIFRWNIYEQVLKWQQQTFHTSGKKEHTWLHSFCAMLGFAMVLEEVQRTILIQADAKAVKGEMSWEAANTEASNACGRIDDRFKLLVGLFQCKYRDKNWGENGSFGPATPRYNDPVVNEFLYEVRGLLERKSVHLQDRRDVQYSMDNQCQYTSRLVARFLLPFLDLPRT